jgi:hypothetical protein
MKHVRSNLIDGLLVREGLLDKNKLAGYLTEDQPFLTVQPFQIIAYLSAEGWLRQWNSLIHSKHSSDPAFSVGEKRVPASS